MATPTYIALATTTLASNSSSVTFSSIPASYRDLVLIIGGSTTSGVNMTYALNGDTTDANYSYVRMYALTATYSSSANNRQIVNMYPTQGVQTIQFMDYSATDKHKTVISRSNTAGEIVMAFASRWANTNAINSIEIAGGTMVTGTVLSLYGIEA